MIPIENKKDLAEVPNSIQKNMEIITVKNVDEVLKIALTKSQRVEWVEVEQAFKIKVKRRDKKYTLKLVFSRIKFIESKLHLGRLTFHEKNIIITGGLGYIGTELCKIYSGYSWNDNITVIDNRFISERVNQLSWNI